jgi:hypothetical protein
MAVKWIRREDPGNPDAVWIEARFLTLWGARRELLKGGFEPLDGTENIHVARWPDSTIFAIASINRALADNMYVARVSYRDKDGKMVKELPPRPY